MLIGLKLPLSRIDFYSTQKGNVKWLLPLLFQPMVKCTTSCYNVLMIWWISQSAFVTRFPLFHFLMGCRCCIVMLVFHLCWINYFFSRLTICFHVLIGFIVWFLTDMFLFKIICRWQCRKQVPPLLPVPKLLGMPLWSSTTIFFTNPLTWCIDFIRIQVC